MPGNADRHRAGFRPPHQFQGALPHLGDTARQRLRLRHIYGLDGINDHHTRLQLLNLTQYRLQVGFRQQEKPLTTYPQPLRPQFYLAQRFLAGDIYHPAPRLSYQRRNLQKYGRFSNTGVATDQHQRAGDQSTANHPVKLAQRKRKALRRVNADL